MKEAFLLPEQSASYFRLSASYCLRQISNFTRYLQPTQLDTVPQISIRMPSNFVHYKETTVQAKAMLSDNLRYPEYHHQFVLIALGNTHSSDARENRPPLEFPYKDVEE